MTKRLNFLRPAASAIGGISSILVMGGAAVAADFYAPGTSYAPGPYYAPGAYYAPGPYYGGVVVAPAPTVVAPAPTVVAPAPYVAPGYAYAPAPYPVTVNPVTGRRCTYEPSGWHWCWRP